jgi:hypothetical protein
MAMEERWEPEAFTTWNFSAIAYPTSRESNLRAISCTKLLTCVAAGDYIDSKSTEVTFVEDGNQTQTTPNPAEAKASNLQGISCVSPEPTECMTVGESLNSTGTQASLIESFSNKTWSILKITEPPGTTASSLHGVSCAVGAVKLMECIAVGNYTNKSGVTATLAESWNGKALQEQEGPTVSGAKISILHSVSCNATKLMECVAVGHEVTKTGLQTTLAERWNGKAWTVQETPSPEGAKSSNLQGVSCASTTICTATGEYTNKAGTEVTLAEGWNGKAWTVQTTPNPEGAKSSNLQGVSCASTTICTATGEYTNKAGVQTTLAEGFG